MVSSNVLSTSSSARRCSQPAISFQLLKVRRQAKADLTLALSYDWQHFSTGAPAKSGLANAGICSGEFDDADSAAEFDGAHDIGAANNFIPRLCHPGVRSFEIHVVEDDKAPSGHPRPEHVELSHHELASMNPVDQGEVDSPPDDGRDVVFENASRQRHPRRD